ncbi:hypothetical protein BGX23_010645 [Mortierella sp. AD031]|nr:hypothetical protein BGX23_010645 [Mortierella sp. AD031]
MRQAIVVLFATLALISVVLSAPVDPVSNGLAVEPPIEPVPGGPAVDPGSVDPAPGDSDVDPGPTTDLDPEFDASAAPLLPNGNYVINRESYHNPIRYFSGHPNRANWAVDLPPRTTTADVLQVWHLRNHSSGLISLELVGKAGFYLGLGRGGALPGAYTGTTNANQQKWRISQEDPTRFKLTYPIKVNGQNLVLDQSPDAVDPPRLAFAYENDGQTPQTWRVSAGLGVTLEDYARPSEAWHLQNQPGALIPFESVDHPGYFLYEGQEGVSGPGAVADVTNDKMQHVWGITKVGSGDPARYKLIFPNKVNGQDLVLDKGTEVEPHRIVLKVEVPNASQVWVFEPVS